MASQGSIKNTTPGTSVRIRRAQVLALRPSSSALYIQPHKAPSPSAPCAPVVLLRSVSCRASRHRLPLLALVALLVYRRVVGRAVLAHPPPLGCVLNRAAVRLGSLRRSRGKPTKSIHEGLTRFLGHASVVAWFGGLCRAFFGADLTRRLAPRPADPQAALPRVLRGRKARKPAREPD